MVCLGLIGIAVAAGLVLASGRVELRGLHDRTIPGVGWWAGMGAVLVAGAALGWRLLERGARGGLIVTVAGSAVLFAAPLAAWGLPRVEVRKAARPLALALPADQTQREVRVAAYRYFQPSLVFYCQREVQRCDQEWQAVELLAGPLPSFLFVPEGVWAEMAPRFPGGCRVLARHADVYSGRTIVVVRNEPAAVEKELAGTRHEQ
jgi:hypothetical protein